MKTLKFKKDILGKNTKIYNASIIKYLGKIFLFYRVQKGDRMKDSTIEYMELDSLLKPLIKTRTEIRLPILSGECRFVDPRAFIFSGKLWLSYSAYDEKSNLSVMGCCELDDSLIVRKVIYFDYGKNIQNLKQFGKGGKKDILRWEKNWQFFENNHNLYTVYSINPHIVLKLSPNLGKCTAVYRSSYLINWRYGVLRGGTPPIRVGNNFFSFFHSSKKVGIKKVYYLGAYCFSAKPPFKIKAITKRPILSGRIPNELGAAVVFPCGAIFERGGWTVSYGYNDESTRIMKLNHSTLMKCMTPVAENLSPSLIAEIINKLDLVSMKRILIYKVDKNIGRVGKIIKRASPGTYLFLKERIMPRISKKLEVRE